MSISPTLNRTPLMIWMLYFSILLSAWLCASGHGQMAGMQLSGLNGEHCAMHESTGSHTSNTEKSTPLMGMQMSGDCVLGSLISAVLLAALFGLLSFLSGVSPQPLAPLREARSPRDRWPLANPRASPSILLTQ